MPHIVRKISSMDPKLLQKLTTIKEKFRDLSQKDRERLSVSLLKINLGVQSDEEYELVKNFIADLEIDLEPEKLDHFMGYLHSSSSNIPVDLLHHPSHDDIAQAIQEEITKKFKKSDLKTYDEEELDTIKEKIKPFKND